MGSFLGLVLFDEIADFVVFREQKKKDVIFGNFEGNSGDCEVRGLCDHSHCSYVHFR